MPTRTLVALLAAACGGAAATEPASPLRPSAAFAQIGVAEDARALVAGLTWDTRWQWRWSGIDAKVYWEASLGRWSPDGEPWAIVTQVGLTPVLRVEPLRARGWFAEAAIGFNLLTPVYRNGDKVFSTRFNFGDHLALGRRFGADQRHEIALRLQHFSNGGVRSPNPGEDFVQLRYAFRLP